MAKNNSLKLLFVALLVLFSLYKLYPTYRYHSVTPEERSRIELDNPEAFKGAIKLGLDLQGGIRLVFQIDRSQLSEPDAKDALSRALEIIRNRVDQFGVSEPVVQIQGTDRIIVELPGFQEIERAKKLVGSTALLEFKLVREAEDVGPALDALDRFARKTSGGQSPSDSGFAAGTAADSADGTAGKAPDTSKVQDLFGESGAESTAEAADSGMTDEEKTALKYEKEILSDKPFSSLLVKADYDLAVPKNNVEKVKRMLERAKAAEVLSKSVEFAWASKPDGAAGSEYRRLYLVKSKAELTGTAVKDANPSINQGGLSAGESVVNMELTGEGSQRFGRITGANIDKRLAIVLDGQVYSAPVIRAKITKNAEISGMANMEEARDLSIVLRAGSLPAPLEIIEERTVGPTLGQDSINQGMLATLVAALLVILFIIAYYKGSGVIAVIAMFLNVVFTFGVLAGMGLTFTLPGVAGLILTIGMSVDANVIIYERIKEEMATGKTARMSIEAGYQRAFWTIFDSNFTTIITAVILDYYGTGPLKGFAVTLIIGLIANLFTAVWVTHLIFNEIGARFKMEKLSI